MPPVIEEKSKPSSPVLTTSTVAAYRLYKLAAASLSGVEAATLQTTGLLRDQEGDQKDLSECSYLPIQDIKNRA